MDPPEQDDTTLNKPNEVNTSEDSDSVKPAPRSPSKYMYRRSKPDTWHCNINKCRCLEGIEYNKQNTTVWGERALGPIDLTMLGSKFCVDSNKRLCSEFNDRDQDNIFGNFWAMDSWECKRTFEQSLVSNGEVKQKRSLASRRETSFYYNLKKPNGSIFISLQRNVRFHLSISNRTIGSWFSLPKQGENSKIWRP